MKASFVALFFRLNEALFLQRKHVLLDPADFFPGHAETLEVHGNSGQMGRGEITAFGRGVRIVAAELPLDFGCTHGGIDLNLVVKLPVIIGAQIVDKIPRPGTAIAAMGIESRLNAQSLVRNDRHELAVCNQLFKLFFILDARQLQAIHFFVLDHHGFARRAEHRRPEDAMNARAMLAGVNRAVRRADRASKRRKAHNHEHHGQREQSGLGQPSHFSHTLRRFATQRQGGVFYPAAALFQGKIFR